MTNPPKTGEEKIPWIHVDDEKPGYAKRVLVLYLTIHGKWVEAVATLQLVSKHAGKHSPLTHRWFVFPGWGHEIKPTYWMSIPSIPDALLQTTREDR